MFLSEFFKDTMDFVDSVLILEPKGDLLIEGLLCLMKILQNNLPFLNQIFLFFLSFSQFS